MEQLWIYEVKELFYLFFPKQLFNCSQSVEILPGKIGSETQAEWAPLRGLSAIVEMP